MKFVLNWVSKRSPNKSYSRVFVTLIFSFIGVMLLPILLALVLGIHSIEAVSHEIRVANESAKENLLAEINSVLSAATQLSYRNAGNPMIRSYAGDSERQYFTEYQICQQMGLNLVGFDGVGSSYLYMPQFELVLTARGSCDADRFFAQNYGGSAEEWYALLESSTMPTRTCFFYSKGAEKPDQFVLIRCVSRSNETGLPVVVVTNINKEVLNNKMQTLCRTPKDQYVFYNESGIILSSSKESESLLAAGDANSAKNDETTFLLLKEDSLAYPVSLLYAVPENFENSSVQFVWWYVLLSLSLCFVISLVLCLVLARRSYRPVRKICSLLGQEMDALLANEYSVIENVLEDYQKRNAALSNTLAKGLGDFQEMYLEKLLLGKVLNSESVKDSLDIYGLPMKAPFFALVLFDLGEDSVLFREDSLDERQRQSLTKLIIQNIATELFSQFCGAFIMQVDEQFVCICNTNSEGIETADKLWELAKKTVNFIEENFFIVFTPHVSKIYQHAGLLPIAYREVTKLSQKAQLKIIDEEAEKGHPDCIERCIALIKAEYSDNNLSLSSIAEQLELSPSYLSRYFKQQTGVGLLDYLHRYRLSVAKEMIQRDSTVLMKEVAERCGFYNDSALTRVFKKLEGITPSQFREMNNQI